MACRSHNRVHLSRLDASFHPPTALIKTRTYTPLLEAYSKLDVRLQDCMALWREAVSPPEGQGLTMTEREYLHLIVACTRARDEKW